jgi:diaminohydroxyphosphoribosylaminopyrimidine deaminase/5-amino-6-(5-phosphoribosylamino)uracil reductase
VGAVIVDASGRELGAATHTYDGIKHAEVLALEQAGELARGATLYVNLEPCSHQGRTGPCADAVIVAGIRRVVCSMEDPNAQVAGRGFARLRAAGIELEVGLLAAEAKAANEDFAKYIVSGKPLVTLKSAMSLDAKIAPAPFRAMGLNRGSLAGPNVSSGVASHAPSNGQQWITGEAARMHVQQLRHQNDAILVGVGTVIADDPLLTDRSDLPRRRKLLRVILDSHLRIPVTSQVIHTAKDDVLIICSAPGEQAKRALEAKGISVRQVSPAEDERPDFAAIAQLLGEMQITSLLIEGGSSVNATALASGEVDKVFLYFAPTILGANAVPFIANMQNDFGKTCLQHLELHRFGDDFAVEGYFRDPYAVRPNVKSDYA